MSIDCQLHAPKKVKMEKFHSFCTLDLEDEAGSRVCIFFQGSDSHESVAAVAEKIQAVIDGRTNAQKIEA